MNVFLDPLKEESIIIFCVVSKEFLDNDDVLLDSTHAMPDSKAPLSQLHLKEEIPKLQF